MDNGLIFPYPHERAPGEPGDAHRPLMLGGPFGDLRQQSAGPEPVVAKRGGDAGR